MSSDGMANHWRDSFLTTITRITACIAAGILVLAALIELRKVGAPGAPAGWVYAAIVVASAAFVLQLPAIFFRLPSLGRAAAWLSLPAMIGLLAVETNQMAPAWSATEEGKAEAAEQARRDMAQRTKQVAEARAEADRERTAKLQKDTQRAVDELKRLNDQLESCFSWGHRLPALEKTVRDRLHNPAAFEHIETIVTVPDDDRNNLAMRFRAENGFGALRTAIVRGQLVADGCSVQNIGEPTIG